jgi:hypothetical protein
MLRCLLLLLALGLMASAAPAQEREWLLDAGDEEAYLIFGVPDSDDVGLSFWCVLRKDMVNLYLPRPTEELRKFKGKEVPVKLSAGGETVTFRGKLQLVPEGSYSSVEVEMGADHPVLAAMQKTDRLRVRVGNEDLIFPLYDADLAGLIELCRQP